ncbi:hypothetical protein K461DRAFT_302827 [Myriangium duriaei CBS 260.36]|uniref:Uncharacterized protein n=1 Tax=Myriangium duriaei CBS 260.36 TaxID=1168546 RepID=A0A9P4ISK9_9PEZI|nr:hypothetical protein K461DRAFT_302827 [Myriangium duriaei CBS 260.36]
MIYILCRKASTPKLSRVYLDAGARRMGLTIQAETWFCQVEVLWWARVVVRSGATGVQYAIRFWSPDETICRGMIALWRYERGIGAKIWARGCLPRPGGQSSAWGKWADRYERFWARCDTMTSTLLRGMGKTPDATGYGSTKMQSSTTSCITSQWELPAPRTAIRYCTHLEYTLNA